MKQMLKLAALAAVMTAPMVQAAVGDAAIEDRIKPVAQVCVEGDACAQGEATPAAAAAGGATRSGEDVYKAVCSACHGTGAAGAPMKGNKEQWAPRIEQGLDTLFTHAVNGVRAMPPKGTCMDCSDDEIHGAVEFMVNASK